jgi:hypothetical protein
MPSAPLAANNSTIENGNGDENAAFRDHCTLAPINKPVNIVYPEISANATHAGKVSTSGSSMLLLLLYNRRRTNLGTYELRRCKVSEFVDT